MEYYVYYHPAVDGKWGRWTDWSQCDATCGGGNKRRTRVCDNPAPRNDGKQCIGNPIENHTCNNNKCSGQNSN